MKQPSRDPLAHRLDSLKAQLAAKLEGDDPASELEVLARQVDVLQRLAQRRRHHRSLAWTMGAAAAALAVAGAMELQPLDRTDVVAVATTRAFTFQAGSSSTSIFMNAIPARTIVTSVGDLRIARCREPQPGPAPQASSAPCAVPVTTLRLNTLVLNPQAKARLRREAACFEVEVLEGGGRADLTFEPRPASSGRRAAAATPVREVVYEPVELATGAWVRVCPDDEATAQIATPSSLTLSDRTRGGLAEQRDVPALVEGTLSIASSAQPVTLRKTDVPRLGDLEDALVVARLGDPIDVTAVVRAGRIEVQAGPRRRSLMPSCLDRVRNSASLKGLLVVLGAVLSAVLAARERWLGEVA